MTTPRVVCCGEALIDLICADSTGRRWRAAPGGSPFNAAVAAGRLGAPTSFLGVFSEDRFGRLLLERLDGSHVDHRHCVITHEPTTLAVVDDGGGGGEPSFSFHVADTTVTSSRVNDLHLPVDTGVLGVSGSVAMVLEPAAARFEGLLAAAQHRSLVQLDPNPRPSLIDRDRYRHRLERWLGLADVVKISEADLAWLEPGSDPMDVAQAWMRTDDSGDERPLAMVITRGARGASVVRSAGVVDVAPAVVDVVDTVGAGDTFAGAMLAAFAAHHVTSRARLDALDAAWWRTALGYAALAAGIACARVGADPPWRHELQ